MIGQAFGNVLRALREERKVTQVLLAEYTELEPNYISMLERGLRQPTLTTIFKIGTALKIALRDSSTSRINGPLAKGVKRRDDTQCLHNHYLLIVQLPS